MIIILSNWSISFQKKEENNMKKVLALVLALVMCLALVPVSAETAAPVKVGVLVPVMTHGWVSGITYQAEAYAKELEAAGKIEYRLTTSSNAEEMTAQIDEAIQWGAQLLVIAPQWTGMEVPVQNAIDQGVVVVAFDMDIDAQGVLKVTGDNESMGVAGAKFIVDKVGENATVIALPVPTSGSVSELRMAGFNKTIAEIAPGLNVIEYATKFTREDGLKDFADILAANPHIDAVYSLDDETSIGVLQAIEDSGRTDIKAITGGGGCQEYFQLIAENKEIAVSSSLYSPLMIRDCFDVGLAKVAGEDVPAVTVIPSQIVDASNVEEYLDPSNTIY
jgi:ribose transport system substrate-binding protein